MLNVPIISRLCPQIGNQSNSCGFRCKRVVVGTKCTDALLLGFGTAVLRHGKRLSGGGPRRPGRYERSHLRQLQRKWKFRCRPRANGIELGPRDKLRVDQNNQPQSVFNGIDNLGERPDGTVGASRPPFILGYGSISIDTSAPLRVLGDRRRHRRGQDR